MIRTAEGAADDQDAWARELETALEELEAAAVARAKSVVDARVTELMARIGDLEKLLKDLQTDDARNGGTTRQAGDEDGKGRTTSAPATAQRAFPSLPGDLTIAALEEYLKTLGFALDNYRSGGGKVWVYYPSSEFGPVADHLQKHGVGVLHYPNGRPGKPEEHYEIDPFRVIPNE